MAEKSSQISAKFAPNLAKMVRYANDACTVVRGAEYIPAALCRDISKITLAAGIHGGVRATGLNRWLEGQSGFEPRTVLKFAVYLQSLTNEVRPNSDRDKRLLAVYRNFAETGSHRIWGDTPQSALTAAYDWLLYGPGPNPPTGAAVGRHEALEWPNAAAILGAELQVAPGLSMGDVLGAIAALTDAEQVETVGAAVLARFVELTEMAQVVEGAIEVELEPELPCDPMNPLLRLMRKFVDISAPPTLEDCARLAAATKIEAGRIEELLCGWDLPDKNECALLNGVSQDMLPDLVDSYMAAIRLKRDQKIPAGASD
jgi:hypothetical protein